jgi:N-acetylglutamate synthase-like GNAT family acetyltransferase
VMTHSSPHEPSVIYSDADKPVASEVIALFRAAGLNGPLDEPERVAQMLLASQHVITARVDGQLVGLIRLLTDFAFNAFVADLAVNPAFQRKGIGTELLARATASHDGVKYILQTHDAAGFYLKNDFTKTDGCYVRMRRR